jgi:hypothetical protein
MLCSLSDNFRNYVNICGREYRVYTVGVDTRRVLNVSRCLIFFCQYMGNDYKHKRMTYILFRSTSCLIFGIESRGNSVKVN